MQMFSVHCRYSVPISFIVHGLCVEMKDILYTPPPIMCSTNFERANINNSGLVCTLQFVSSLTCLTINTR